MAPYSSLKDVAARAGVSFQTASKVLNGRAGAASADTADRVLEAARDLDYVPSAMARRLVTRSNPILGIVAGDLSDFGLAQFLAGAQRAIHAYGTEAFIVAPQPGADPALSVRKLLEHRVDGILVIAPGVERDRRFARSIQAGLPVVSLNHYPDSTASLVGSDHAETGAIAARHLVSRGHRQIATITGPSTREVVGSRHQGFRRVLREAGVRLPARRVAQADWTSAHAFTATHELLDADATITAVFVHSDVMAVGVLSALAQRGVAVPAECSVMGCDDLPFAAYLAPPLTTVRVPFDETGARAAELLLRKIGGATIPRREHLPVSLVERQSTSSPEPADASTARRRGDHHVRSSLQLVSQEGER